MALRKGRVIAKQNFFDHLYNGLDGPETRVIDVFICNLRKKLSAWGVGSLIDTVRGHGYMMRELADDTAGAGGVAAPVGFQGEAACARTDRASTSCDPTLHVTRSDRVK